MLGRVPIILRVALCATAIGIVLGSMVMFGLTAAYRATAPAIASAKASVLQNAGATPTVSATANASAAPNASVDPNVSGTRSVSATASTPPATGAATAADEAKPANAIGALEKRPGATPTADRRKHVARNSAKKPRRMRELAARVRHPDVSRWESPERQATRTDPGMAYRAPQWPGSYAHDLGRYGAQASTCGISQTPECRGRKPSPGASASAMPTDWRWR
jgi:hypothetical protein